MARGAALLVAISPAAVFFGRVVIPDTPMMFFTVVALIGFAEFAYTGSNRWLVAGAVSLTLACLLKLPAVFLGPAIATLLVQVRGWRVFRDPRAGVDGRHSAAPADRRVVLARPPHLRADGPDHGHSGGADEDVSRLRQPGPWPSIYSKWSTAALLTDINFYERMFMHFYACCCCRSAWPAR